MVSTSSVVGQVHQSSGIRNLLVAMGMGMILACPTDLRAEPKPASAGMVATVPAATDAGRIPSTRSEEALIRVIRTRMVILELEQAQDTREERINRLWFADDYRALSRAWGDYERRVRQLREEVADDPVLYHQLNRIARFAGDIRSIYNEGRLVDSKIGFGSRYFFFESTMNPRALEIHRLKERLTDAHLQFAR
ncbi:hypothetical protein [Tuwongella immobilis]|uniref:Uncharacterized protein n=1 Tax=Tuwongella immobilis TaxID=692036 RepID=A0A6C2YL08_9BACT|nr:hypothetical protein [Tuwongella immobilis]VIP02057.1 unnamed protein product [Tuwongella immobilis]VTS00258.1 unnamed protein product [Tuwongella immobilis]